MDAIWYRLANDATILDLLDLTDETQLETARRIIKRREWDELAASEKRLCIYFRPSRPSGLDIVTDEVVQVDCHVPAKQDYKAYRVQKRVKELLHEYETGGRTLLFNGQLGELPSAAGFFCAGSRYRFYSLI